MKREILFRGKRVDTGEWIYGDLIKHSIIDPFKYIAIGAGYKIDNPEIGKAIKVLPSTVGQFTGMTDKNGNRIFEGDIYSMGEKNILYVVIFDKSQFIGKQVRNRSLAGLEYWKSDIEIVGNIHDNPELL